MQVLRNALGEVTDEDALTTVIVMHADKDLKAIKELFHKRTSETLEHMVGKETGGNYKSFLLELIGTS